MKSCFICKTYKQVKPIGLKKLKSKEIYLCGSCNEYTNKIEVVEIVSIKSLKTKRRICL